MSRTVLIAGNWKMHKTPDEAEHFVDKLLARWTPALDVELALFPPFPALDRCGHRLRGSAIALGAQNVHHEPRGAFTGEVSCDMLVACGCRYVLVGHSERRHVFGEGDDTVCHKLHAVIDTAGLSPVLCVGETLEERKRGDTQVRLGAQLESALASLPQDDAAELVIAYEPVWAIGTGANATRNDAEEACRWIRADLDRRFGRFIADTARILYGGSVNPDNAAELLRPADVDGVLVGGASLDTDSFLAIAAQAPGS